MKNIQHGVGLVEVLVALVLLAIGILGFIGLQLKAIDASAEARQQVLALTIARDLAERMRANPEATLKRYYQPLVVSEHSVAKIAKQDVLEIQSQAKDYGMNLVVDQCPSGKSRQCIYVAWNTTLLVKDGKTDLTQCIENGTYVPNSHCLFLEAY
ncbi:hypothetical protein GCM10025882_06070 [Acinetobacter gyllenbergii]|uniref:Type IV pilus modification protein PilV n=1 Tax=Acinetobacter gyllenbergii CIP 110306 = MTCC 11365 TaxID=1217657 RepID=A0A829HKF4_9GAMM|nr:type IV pilus modification protein PilV [Acinetobacter gyllenbergii]EPF93075.1 type IV pilus modification protein PilV [Acinetobacter gyllenbergii CIP 110306 = MTCC 11365]EPH31385.1 Type IV fimbrial biogenesis protein PilV [Acinetobacter gyllenbergii CIP 110306 = MTCC 11365]ESK36749.1 type IV pilus modification protein PilV [Acinetobacter gyllenbergii NIPH 230]MCU4579696.1 type IV pilus modification protein PilV [Acinetobacter gyllenbergii]OBY74286.1 pilus assembly protein [Acinetobacter gy